jgi:hypothetical protein
MGSLVTALTNRRPSCGKLIHTEEFLMNIRAFAGTLLVLIVGCRQSTQTAIGTCMVAGRSVPADPVTGCNAPYPVPAAPEVCPIPIPTLDTAGHLLPDIKSGRIDSQTRPVYPYAYLDKGLTAAVAATCIVSVDGKLCGCKLLPGNAPDAFGASFLGWLRSGQAHMTPFTKNGVPVTVEPRLELHFETATYR